MILDHTHVTLLDEFFDHCISGGEVISERERVAWSWARKNVLLGNPEAVVSVEVQDDKIELFSLCYTINAFWELQRNSIPEWVVGLTRARQKTNKIRKFDIERLIIPFMERMENAGRNAFYMSRLVPDYVNWSNIEDYIGRIHPLIGNITRYDARAIHILNCQEDLDTLPTMFRSMVPNSWPAHKKSVVIRHDLKYQHRK